MTSKIKAPHESIMFLLHDTSYNSNITKIIRQNTKKTENLLAYSPCPRANGTSLIINIKCRMEFSGCNLFSNISYLLTDIKVRNFTKFKTTSLKSIDID